MSIFQWQASLKPVDILVGRWRKIEQRTEWLSHILRENMWQVWSTSRAATRATTRSGMLCTGSHGGVLLHHQCTLIELKGHCFFTRRIASALPTLRSSCSLTPFFFSFYSPTDRTTSCCLPTFDREYRPILGFETFLGTTSATTQLG